MGKIDEKQEFDSSEMDMIAKALILLLNERSRLLEVAVEIASANGQYVPSHDDFGLSSILRLSRRCSAYASLQTNRADEDDSRMPPRWSTGAEPTGPISDGGDRA